MISKDRSGTLVRVAWFFAFLLLVSTSYISLPKHARAQGVDVLPIQPGYKAVSGFSGTHIPNIELGIPLGVDPLDETLINVDEPSVRIFDVSVLGGPAAGQLVNTPPPFEVFARDVGQVFGLAFDDGKDASGQQLGAPNLYATATVLHGLQIVEEDKDADSRPERLKSGKPGAKFMDGQFGPNNAGPGAVYRIDGVTGAVTLFAQIPGNSGGALGNIAFDHRNRQFFVSDIDTGLIHRLSIDGQVLDAFDHGKDGLAYAKFPVLADDGVKMDITSPLFDPANPATWGLTQDGRRVWGVAVYENRLFYAATSRPEIWSVELDANGKIVPEPVLEIATIDGRDYPATDLVFDSNGHLYMAQRAPVENFYDYSRFAFTEKSEVHRYLRETPDDPATVPLWREAAQLYATGLPIDHKQSAGGIDLQYGYDSEGNIDYRQCEENLFKTGDHLQVMPNPNPTGVAKSQGANSQGTNIQGSSVVHGTQLTNLDFVEPRNVPPNESWYFDQDGRLTGPEIYGHVGDVEVYRNCGGRNRGKKITTIKRVPNIDLEIKACIETEAVFASCAAPGVMQIDLYAKSNAPQVGANTMAVRSKTPGVASLNGVSTRLNPNPSSPFNYLLTNTFPGQTVTLDVCLYNQNHVQPGFSYPCCKGTIEFTTPTDLFCF